MKIEFFNKTTNEIVTGKARYFVDFNGSVWVEENIDGETWNDPIGNIGWRIKDEA